MACNSNYRCITHRAHKSQLAEVNMDPAIPERTALDTNQVFRDALALYNFGNDKQAKALLKSRGMLFPPVQSAMQGFLRRDYMQI